MRYLSIFICLLTLASSGLAATIHVPADQPTIQAGINAAVNGDTVLVAPGTYTENITFPGKNIVVMGQSGPLSTSIIPFTTSSPIVLFGNSETSGAIMTGFTFSGAYGNPAIRITNGSPIIEGNYFTNNRGTSQEQSIMKLSGAASPIIRHNLFYANPNAHAAIHTDEGNSVIFTNNTIHTAERGIVICGSGSTIRNNIVTSCTSYGLFDCYRVSDRDYNDIWGNSMNYYTSVQPGPNDTSVDPLFSDIANTDYTLQSTSPCIDAGDPSYEVPLGGGDRIDIGAFEFCQYIPHTIIVPDSFLTIQQAVDSAHAQDTILVRTGTYHENVQISEKNIVLLSEMGVDATFIQSDTSRCLSIRQSTLFISGFRFTGTSSRQKGGAISADTSTIIMRNSIIENSYVNLGDARGGGIYAYASSLDMAYCHLSNNHAIEWNAYGGGLYCVGELVMDSCVIIGNSAGRRTMEPGGWASSGGGIYCEADNVHISRTSISDNLTEGDGAGAGVSIIGNNGIIDGCAISGNWLRGSHRYGKGSCGGGLALRGNNSIVSNCTIQNNMANGGGWGFGGPDTCFGGGVYSAGDNAINNSLIAYNSAIAYADDIYSADAWARGGGVYGFNRIEANTIYGNTVTASIQAETNNPTAFAEGGGAYVYGSMTNNIIATNRVLMQCSDYSEEFSCISQLTGAGVYVVGSPEIECNDYFGNTGANEWQGDCPASNINTNPMFCDTSLGNFSIFDLSPCAPENNACSTLIGAFGVGCNGIPSVNGFGVPDETLTNLLSHYPLISWAYYCPIGNPEDTFEIAVGTNPDWSHAEMWNPEAFAGPDTFITYAGLPLIDGTTYYLRLRVHNGLAWSEWYNTSFRMNSVPTLPVYNSPADNAIVTTTAPAIYLSNSTDAESDPLSYDFEVYDGSENLVASATGIAQQPDSSGWTIDVPLGEDQSYHWRARAFDGYEYSAWTVPISFHVNATEEFPSAFLVYFPPDTDNGQVYDKPVEFIWGTSTDPDPSDSVRYKLMIAIDPGFVFVATHDSIYQTRYPVGNLNYSTHYWWKVQAFDVKGNMTPSTNTADFWTWVLGDANGDRMVNVGDAVFLVSFIFRGGPPPIRLKAGDANGDCGVNVGDAVYLIGYVFRGGPPPQVGCAR